MLLVNNIIKSATRKDGDTLRCLTFCRENEKYLEMLSNANCEIYVMVKEGLSDWKNNIVSTPPNVFVLNKTIEEATIPFFDCVIANDRLHETDLLASISKQLHLPIITIDHASKDLLQKLPFSTSVQTTDSFDHKVGNINISVGSSIKKSWSQSHTTSLEIPFYVDIQKYKVEEDSPPKEGIAIDNNVPGPIMQLFESSLTGTSLGALFVPSEAPEDVLRRSKVYISTWSGLNLKLLEAMSSECIVIAPRSLDTESIITKDNGYLFSTLAELREIVPKCLNQNGTEMGKRARQTIKDTCLTDINVFINKWDHVFQYVSNSFFSIAQ